MMKTLQQIVQEKPYPEYQAWWPMGPVFTKLMQRAIVGTWQAAAGTAGDRAAVQRYLKDYIRTVYRQEPDPLLLQSFFETDSGKTVSSGEFDALSYAFYRSAFESLLAAKRPEAVHGFTQEVGLRFFEDLASHLSLSIPRTIATLSDVDRMQRAVDRVGAFLMEQKYLRDSFSFSFELDVEHNGRMITQSRETLVEALTSGRPAFAVYRMGFPVILPSAVYLYHTLGEAQHHSSRTIEELFARAGCTASETDDFDPIGFPADEVVELWEIHGG